MIYILGDSHVYLFTGRDDWQGQADVKCALPHFKTAHLGPATAYRLADTGTTTQGRERLFATLKAVPLGARVMLSFGEIDIRFHILKQALIQGRLPLNVSQEVACRYAAVLAEVKALGFEVMAWAPVASTWQSNSQDQKLRRTTAARNFLTRVFTEQLYCECLPHGIPVISILLDLMDLDTGETKSEFYLDYFHLSQRAMPFALAALREFI